MGEERLRLPRLYAMVDADHMASKVSNERLTSSICDFAAELAAGGATLMQYRARTLSSREMLSHARELRRVLGPDISLFIDDRSDICLAAGFDGVHLEQDGLSPDGARSVLRKRHWVGISTHSVEQAKESDVSGVDYIAVCGEFDGNPGSTGGLERIGAVRQVSSKPLVAMGGVTRANARAMIEAGADAVAVAEALFEEPRCSAEEFLAILV